MFDDNLVNSCVFQREQHVCDRASVHPEDVRHDHAAEGHQTAAEAGQREVWL